MPRALLTLCLLVLAAPLARADWPAPQLETATGKIADIDGRTEGYAQLVAPVTPRGLSPYAEGDEVLAAVAKEILQCGVSIRGPLCEGGRFGSLEGPWVEVVVAGSHEYRVKGFRDTASDAGRTFVVVYVVTAADPASKYGYIYEAPSAAAGPSHAYGLFTESGVKAKPVLSFSLTGELPGSSAQGTPAAAPTTITQAVSPAGSGVTITETVQLTADHAAKLPHATGGFSPYHRAQFETKSATWVPHCAGMLLQFESNDELLMVTYLNNGVSFPFRCDSAHMRCERITSPTGQPGVIETPATFEFLADGSIIDVEEPQARVYRRVTDCPAR